MNCEDWQVTSAGLKIERGQCPGCGTDLISPDQHQPPRCPVCADSEPTPAEPGAESLFDFAQPRGYGVLTHSLLCRQCGAAVGLADKLTTQECYFCASALVLEQPGNVDLIRPESLIPFQIGREEAYKLFQSWVSSLWFRPYKLYRMAQSEEIRGVYVPFWSFDTLAETCWSAQSGHHYDEEEQVSDAQGRTQTRPVRRTRWEACAGHRQTRHNDFLVCASQGLPEPLLEALQPFHLDQSLRPYSGAYLSGGWAAEEYVLPPGEAWSRARFKIGQLETLACRREVPGETQRDLKTDTRLTEVSWRHCLLPIYIAAYRYRNKTYRFLINGETGKVSGEAPYSPWKIALVGLTLTMLLLVLAGSMLSTPISSKRAATPSLLPPPERASARPVADQPHARADALLKSPSSNR